MPARSRPARTAILVIHGIGEQNPYETLDSFARGLVQYFASSRPSAKVSLEPERINHGDWTEAAVHVDGVDRKSTRLNSSHLVISYAVFCLKKKKKEQMNYTNIVSMRE